MGARSRVCDDLPGGSPHRVLSSSAVACLALFVPLVAVLSRFFRLVGVSRQFIPRSRLVDLPHGCVVFRGVVGWVLRLVFRLLFFLLFSFLFLFLVWVSLLLF